MLMQTCVRRGGLEPRHWNAVHALQVNHCPVVETQTHLPHSPHASEFIFHVALCVLSETRPD